MSQPQPLITRKLAIRLVVGLFLLVAVLLVFQLIRTYGRDPDFGAANTAGMVLATEFVTDGSRVVLIGPDGKKTVAPGYKEGVTDREPVWLPNGSRVFFSSNRESPALNIYRWNPANNRLERKSFGTRSQGNISFGPKGHAEELKNGIITSGGFVLLYTPADGATRQLLPPILSSERVSGAEGEGALGQFSVVYNRLGDSFRSARFGPDRKWIAAVMRRDTGEVLIVQELEERQDAAGRRSVPPPQVVGAGEHIEFDIGPQGQIAVSIQAFEFPDRENVPPEFIKNGKAVHPYRHALFVVTPGGQGEDVLISQNDEVCPGKPRFSSDGSSLAVVIGSWREPGQLEPFELALMPATRGGARLTAHIVRGEVREQDWHPSGRSLIYVKRTAAGRRAIFTVNNDGSEEKNLTGDTGDYANPQFSPQLK